MVLTKREEESSNDSQTADYVFQIWSVLGRAETAAFSHSLFINICITYFRAFLLLPPFISTPFVVHSSVYANHMFGCVLVRAIIFFRSSVFSFI